ncbi:MAG TPA: FUSC family protein [Stellaceae bacterium]|nr:FUSC family protein [Stellaceae bacterium]
MRRFTNSNFASHLPRSVNGNGPIAVRWLQAAWAATRSPLVFGIRLWVSVCLSLYIAFWLELDNPYWAGTTAALVCQPHLGASLRKGWYRMIGTIVGGIAIVVLTACFPQDRIAFLAGLALWGAACALIATILRNFLAHAAQLAGVTAAIIAGNQLGATGGVNGEAFTLAVTRCTEICIGIVCAGIVLAGTDFGSADRRLAARIASIATETIGRFAAVLAVAGPEISQTQPIRQELARRVIELDTIIEEAIGESSQLRQNSPVLRAAVDGLLKALAAWRVLAVHLAQLTHDEALQLAAIVSQAVPNELRPELQSGDPGRWLTNPVGLGPIYEQGVAALNALSADTPSLRLLVDQTADVLAGVSCALNGLALLVGDFVRPVLRRGGVRLHVPDWLPPLIDAARVSVAIGAVELFWIVTAWPNGAFAITFAAIGTILFASRGDQAYPATMSFTIGTFLVAALAAIIGFAVLPKLTSFVGFSLAIGLVLVPAGAGVAQSWRTPMFTAIAAFFCFLLAPTNQMTYDTQQFYNGAAAAVAGLGSAALSFRLLPLLPPAARAHRLLSLTLRDLRRLARGKLPQTPEDWEDRVYGRLSVLPDPATPLQRSQLLAALSVGCEIIRLRNICSDVDLGSGLDEALAALAGGNSAAAVAKLADLDAALTARPGTAILRARAGLLAISEAFIEHAAYFDAAARG